ncbi:hypothetical protein HWV62_33185 [Athelia sp. TMB]|nr:hypothetical protein HWV62_33185 [Athelia sp. TMB]
MRHLSILPRNFTQDLYSILHSRSQSGPLFRHLTSLEWRSYSLAQPNLFSTIVPFINNSLKHLLIIFPYSEDGNEGHEAAQLLSTLPTQTPALKLLSVKGSSHVANAAFEAVCSLSHLETLYTEDFGIPQVYLVPLARLNNLRRLSLTLNKYTHLTNPAAVVPAFHSLEAIYLDTTEPFYATLFILKFLTGAPLREFTLKFPHFLHPDAAMHLASAMVHAFHHDLITSIRIWCSDCAAARPGDPIYMLDTNMLRKLFVFRYLEIFNFNISKTWWENGDLSIISYNTLYRATQAHQVLLMNVKMMYAAVDDMFITDLIARWPAMRALSLVPAGRTPCPVTRLTLQGLIHFNKSRNITDLRVLFDGSNCDIWPDYPPANGLSCPSLRHLDVHASSFNTWDLETMASLISDLFPNLKDDIGSFEPSFEEQDVLDRTAFWSAVSARIIHFS